MSRLAAMLAEAKAAQSKVALLMLDLDKFKQINDTLGHACGDQLLLRRRRPAERAWPMAPGLVARLSGDEFAVVLSGADAADRAKTLAERTVACVQQDSRSLVGAPPDRRQCQHRSGGLSRMIARPPTSSSATPTLLSIARRPAAAADSCFSSASIRDELEARLSLEAELGARLRTGMNSSCSISRRSVCRTADWSARKPSFAGGIPNAAWCRRHDFMPVVNASLDFGPHRALGHGRPPAGKAACGSSRAMTFASASIFRRRSFNRATSRRPSRRCWTTRASRLRCLNWRSPKTSCWRTTNGRSKSSSDSESRRQHRL